ncbi:DUF3299 domain-containing protein [Carboxylicivirga marina]|uniref:DUF3299 domain-containing protein n=1 Tax=Carboxylicivirga marina TaxID=2800988 RepID=A0ABS1HHQ9_9BACT|nr:DUF3299 domain-containing protein [Carboxylicivirga marina]MBK3516739.1 DUF3299 domain-containing protein [Carboxylicivirga marina]
MSKTINISGLIFLGLFVHLIGLAQNPKELAWADLIPKPIEYPNPFKEIEPAHLKTLSQIAKAKTLIRDNPAIISKSLIAEVDSIEKSLAKQGVDAEAIFQTVDKIAEQKKQRALSTVNELDGIKVKMPGFLLPLEMVDNKATEFLLVPWVGACIHTPPPPINQIVFIKFMKGHTSDMNFEAVWVEGVMSVQSSVKQLFLVDGTDDISSGYSLTADKIYIYN